MQMMVTERIAVLQSKLDFCRLPFGAILRRASPPRRSRTRVRRNGRERGESAAELSSGRRSAPLRVSEERTGQLKGGREGTVGFSVTVARCSPSEKDKTLRFKNLAETAAAVMEAMALGGRRKPWRLTRGGKCTTGCLRVPTL